MILIAKITGLAIFSYIIGSIPFGLILGKQVKGIDIRNFGSGNIGATNVTRVVGFKWGVLVFILDFLKGFLPVFLVFLLLPKDSFGCRITSIIAAMLAVAGHNWPVYLKFKGGKGVSTSIGVIASLSVNLSFLRTPLILSVLAWLIVFLFSRLVGLASLVCALMFFISCLAMAVPWEFKFLSFLIALFITIRHKKNIKDIIEICKVKRVC